MVKSLIHIEYIFNCSTHISLLSLFTYLYMCVSNLVDIRVLMSYAVHRVCVFTYYDMRRICIRYAYDMPKSVMINAVLYVVAVNMC